MTPTTRSPPHCAQLLISLMLWPLHSLVAICWRVRTLRLYKIDLFPMTLINGWPYNRQALTCCGDVFKSVGRINELQAKYESIFRVLCNSFTAHRKKKLFIMNRTHSMCRCDMPLCSRFDIVLMQICSCVIKCYFTDRHHESFFTCNNVTETRGNSLKLLVPNSRVNARADFFSVPVIMVWNQLPDDIVRTRALK